jgi:RHS repeat-associated protein
VKKGSVVMVYDAFGRLAAEYGGTADPVGTEYLTADHLGSTRLVTSSTGAERRCLDYLPFGEQMTQGMGTRGACYASATEPRVKFTGKERDAETGLDYFLARYYSAAQGRFTSPDEFQGGIVDPFTGQQVGAPGPLPYADITGPQTLNKYAYVRNNPLRYIDPNGHVIDEVADAAFIVYDLYKIVREGATSTNVAALGADVAGALIPGITGLGAAVRAERSVEAGVQGARLVREGLALGREITGVEAKIARQMKHLDAEHIRAAARELKGEVVKINPRDGKPFDHVTEVREAAQGLQNQANKIKSMLGSGDLTKKARATLENSLRQVNKKLEELKQAGVI